MFEQLIPALTKKEDEILKSFMQASSAPAGTVLVDLGNTERDLYFVIEGYYEIYQRVLVSGQSTVLHLASLSGPSLIGEVNLFLGEVRQASILVTTECKYFLLTHEKLESLKSEHPHIALKIIEHAGKTLTQRLRDSQNRIYKRLITSAETPYAALQNMNNFIGPTRECSLALSKKLFPQESICDSWKDTVIYTEDETKVS